MNSVKKLWRVQFVGTFLAGLGVLLPIILTVLIVDWLIGKAIGLVGPETALGNLLTTSGAVFLGGRHSTIAFWLGVAMIMVVIWVLGVFVKLITRNRFDRATDQFFNRFPLVRSVYKTVAEVSGQFSQSSDGKFVGMSVCAVKFGENGGGEFLALKSCREVFSIAGESKVLVYIPTSPIPMSGGLVLVPENSITLMPDVSVDMLLRVYFSLGTLASGIFPHAAKSSNSTAS